MLLSYGLIHEGFDALAKLFDIGGDTAKDMRVFYKLVEVVTDVMELFDQGGVVAGLVSGWCGVGQGQFAGEVVDLHIERAGLVEQAQKFRIGESVDDPVGSELVVG